MNESQLQFAYRNLRESPDAKRRLEHERELERVSVGSPEGQELLERWGRENAQAQRAARDPR